MRQPHGGKENYSLPVDDAGNNLTLIKLISNSKKTLHSVSSPFAH